MSSVSFKNTYGEKIKREFSLSVKLLMCNIAVSNNMVGSEKLLHILSQYKEYVLVCS